MFGEQIIGQFGRVVLFAGAQRGGADGGPVCRFVLDSFSGALLDLGRIDCFAVEPHHHTELPRMNAAVEYPEELRTDLAQPGQRLTLSEWEGCARRAVTWLRESWSRELREGGWSERVVFAAERDNPALADAVEAFLLAHPPTGLSMITVSFHPDWPAILALSGVAAAVLLVLLLFASLTRPPRRPD